MKVDNICNWLYELFDKSRKIGRMNFSEDEFRRFLNTIQSMNSLPRFQRTFMGIPLHEWQVPEVLKGLVYPDSVTVSCDDMDQDFLQRDECVPESECLSYVEFNRFAAWIGNLFKTSESTVSLDELKKPMSLASDGALKRMTYNGNSPVMLSELPLVPVTVRFLDERCYTYREDECVKAFWNHVLNTYSGTKK